MQHEPAEGLRLLNLRLTARSPTVLQGYLLVLHSKNNELLYPKYGYTVLCHLDMSRIAVFFDSCITSTLTEKTWLAVH